MLTTSLVPINLRAEATRIAMEELRVLADRVWAYECANSSTHPTLVQLLAAFQLADPTYRYDPWYVVYRWDTTDLRFESDGDDQAPLSADDVVVPRKTQACPTSSGPTAVPVPAMHFDFELAHMSWTGEQSAYQLPQSGWWKHCRQL